MAVNPQASIQFLDGGDPSKGIRGSLTGTISNAKAALGDLIKSTNLDAGTNELCVERRLHVDHVYLHAKWQRGKKEHKRTFLLQSSTGLHNSARFGAAR